MVEIQGYDSIDEVLRTGSYAVWRATRVRDGHRVLLKAPARVPPPAADLEALAREFSLRRELSLPGAPPAYELLHPPATACLVLEDRGYQSLSSLLTRNRPSLAAFFGIAAGVCAVIGALHRRNLVHGALDPAGILADDAFQDLQFTDLGVATRGSTGAGLVSAPAYLSPEQTGRTNRTVDYRTDFYSLGGILYALLVGRPPFVASDSLELIHAHLAKTPVPPSAIDATIPEPVSLIVMRLLAKAAEDRYQSILGVDHDLRICAREWAAEGQIRPFALGQHDVSERFLIPQKLYGRDREVATLLEAFDETCRGGTGLMLVAGYSGIGKSSLISELYKPIVRQRGYFVAGKFDHVVRDIPHGALIQAFRGLVRQLLAESEERLASWRATLADALGANVGVLAEVIPEIEIVLGKAPPLPPLDPAETQNRFRFVFQNFVGAVAREEHPLIVFLDDLQWADAATLALLHVLLVGASLRHLLVVGAYRDNEVDGGHPLVRAIAGLERAAVTVRRIALGPLTRPDLALFLRATLHGPDAALEPLADLILHKTDGNPFFVIQFLRALHQDGLFEFDGVRGRWTFRMDAIAATAMTDNVIDLMTRRIRRLSPSAQDVLTLAACIGSPFQGATLLTVSRRPANAVEAALAETIEAGLIRPAEGAFEGAGAGDVADRSYAFAHDRIQQAAYGLIPDAAKAPVHLDVGRLLLAECDGVVPDDRIFQIVNHLNVGRALIDGLDERLAVARLNLTAARKAKASTAYEAATTYLETGLALVTDDLWASAYDLLFALFLENAECQYLAGRFERAERDFDILLARAATPLDQAQVHSLRIVLYENLSRYAEAVSSGRAGLALFGIALPASSADAQAVLDAEIETIARLLGDRAIASLIQLPRMTDPDIRMVMRILTALWAPAYLSGNERLTQVISATMVRLSLAHGNTEDSAYGYVTHAITIGPIRRDYRAAYEWGELALRVNLEFDSRKHRAKIHQQFHAHVKLWRRPFESCIPHAREARRSGLETGDFTYAGYGAVTEAWPALLVCRDLDRFVNDHTPTLALLERIRMSDFRGALRVILNWAQALQGRTLSPLSLSSAELDEAAFIATYETTAPFFLTFVYTARLHLAVLLEDFPRAVEAAARARSVTAAGTIWPVLVDFWGGLAMAGAWASADAATRVAYEHEIDAARDRLAELADNCPENFRCFWLLMAAERERLAGAWDRRLALCEEAVTYARLTENLALEALGQELTARTWLAHGDEAAAARCLREAHRGYARWGAAVKARQLSERHAHLLNDAAMATGQTVATGPATGGETAALDLATVLKVAHAIAEEIEIEDLLRKLMTLALENAGAERGLFLRERDGTLVVEVQATADPERVERIPSLPLERTSQIAQSIVRYVWRTGEDVVIGDATSDERFAGDAYVQAARARSVLCVPVVQRARIGGILYLENHLSADAFTPQRTEIMRILAAQAGISLENARLYEEMKHEVRRRTEVEQALREAVAELEGLKNRLEAENVYLQEEIRTQHNFNEIVGNSPVLLEALHRVERVAPTESTVLIMGETGSGKELFARAVHSRSRRRDRPLVKVNCGAIAPGLVESELFGHVKGAFTGAIERRVGRFELAHGGTIFLDEVGELSPEAQVKLLRVLQEQEFEPVGSSRTVRVDVRVIAATNRHLAQAVREGKFRADLLYRLNVFPIEVPPLRERRGDLSLLAGFFVSGLSRKLGKPLHGFNARSMERMARYSWPGNVRELQNVVERAAILAPGPILDLEGGFPDDAPPSYVALPQSEAGTLDDVQRARILAVLKQTGGVVEGTKGAATILGLHPNTLRSRMKKLGIATGPLKPS
jgi:predicted ATPase/transcriptional regulator with GAF, ATPase, and Fis domain